MLATTIDATKALLKTDPSLTPGDRNRLLTLLRNHGKSDSTKPAASEPDRIVRRNEAARLLGRSGRAIDRLAAAGVLRRVTLPNRARAAGFRLSDVQGLIAGKGGN